MIKSCLHCGEDTKAIAEDFCCLGCSAAYKIINKLGFENYYNLREAGLANGQIKPEDIELFDISEFVISNENNTNSLSLIVQGMHCAACVWLIENVLRRQENVLEARINLSKRTLYLRWLGDKSSGNDLIRIINQIGYKLLPFDEEILNSAEKKYNDTILRALAVAGFGAGNIMLFSVSLWFSNIVEMGVSTRTLLHFFSSLIALPVIIFSARPFFKSAWNSIKQGYPNMDLAISIAIFLACVVSLLETFRNADHVYFDSAVMLVFFLLIGRYLDLKARKKAFAIATEFSMLSASFGHIEEDGKIKILPSKQLQKDMILVVAAGEKIAADGVVIDGVSEVNTSLITGESLPKGISKGSEVFAGTINIGQPLKIKITKSPQNSLLADIIRLSEEAENKKIHYIRIADYLSKFYTPAVHLLALITFIYWFRTGWEIALMNATAVLIITCPCALALAVPIVQTIAISNFIKKGILVKSGEALEKLNNADVFVFDKTGSLTIGEPNLIKIIPLKGQFNYLKICASLTRKSRHPIALAITAAYDEELLELVVEEKSGFGLEARFGDKKIALGRKEFCQITSDFVNDENLLSCFVKYGDDEAVLLFSDEIKSDAKLVVETLRNKNKRVVLLSGDIEKTVTETARKLGITEYYFEQTPVTKLQFLEKLKLENKKFVMIGDGLNDAPALASSYVSVSFSKATDIAQNIADIVIQGQKLMPIIDLTKSASAALSLMKQNLLIALIYNLVAVPFAVAGYVVPLIAAIAMSSSSLLVLFNSLRMNSKKCQS